MTKGPGSIPQALVVFEPGDTESKGPESFPPRLYYKMLQTYGKMGRILERTPMAHTLDALSAGFSVPLSVQPSAHQSIFIL